jgi:hypothetical protein
MVLIICLIAVLVASMLVPHTKRGGWRRAWIGRIWHYNTLLRDRGVRHRYVIARIWHHAIGAFRDAWHLRADTPGMQWFLAAIRKPAFSLGMIGVALVAIVAASRGLAITRAMIAPAYPEADRLMLICETGGLLNDRHPVGRTLFEYWQAHNESFTGLAGYQWDSSTGWVTSNFFQVLGARPKRFLLHRIRAWKPLDGQGQVGVIGRLKSGVTPAAAEAELRDLAARFRHYQRPAFGEAEVRPLVARIRQPLYSYNLIPALTGFLLLAAAGLGIRADRRRIGRIRVKYWSYFCIKAFTLPLALLLVVWEFTRSTSFSVSGGSTFVAEPFFAWLVILGCGAIAWWCLADQRVRCRACVRTLQYPVRIGSLGAVLFDHAGTELVCCEGHGSLYVPAVSSDYVQRGGWTALDLPDIPDEPVRHGWRAGSHK